MTNERKMVFIYPEALEYKTNQEINNTYKLGNNLKFIVNSVNLCLESIRNNFYDKATGKEITPIVEWISESEFKDEITEFQNIRICLTRVDDEDYSTNYDEVINRYKNNEEDISHLISLSINNRISKVKWKPDAREEFDCEIETNLENLESVLVSIMLDIILYRFFRLSAYLKDRKEFSIKKRDYILRIGGRNLQQYYGVDIHILKKIKYLSIAYYIILKSGKKFTVNEVKKCLTELIEEYWELIKWSEFKKIALNGNYYLYDIEKIDDLDELENKHVFEFIPEICKNNDEKNLIIAFKKDSGIQDAKILKKWNNYIDLGDDSVYKIYNINILEEGG